MLILQEQLLAVPIMSLQTGAAIAETASFIIDPRELKVVGFYCSGPRLDVNPAILTVSDIREIGSVGIIVDNADVLVSPNDLVRLKEVIDIHFTLDNKMVVDQLGQKLGRVSNVTLDNKSLYIVKLHVRPGVWQSFKTTELLIDRTDILQVTDTEVIVKHAGVKKEEKAAPAIAPSPLLDNPFRRAPIEGATTHTSDK